MRTIGNILIKLYKSDTFRRSLKTFVQAFFGVVLVVNFQDIQDMDTIKTVLMSATTAGICAVWNLLKVIIDEKIRKLGKNNT
jgi:hypothetical protein